jgi:hypothetical protein
MNNSDIDKLLGRKGMSNSDKFNLLGVLCTIGFIVALATAGLLVHPVIGWACIALSLFLSAQLFFKCGKEDKP